MKKYIITVFSLSLLISCASNKETAQNAKATPPERNINQKGDHVSRLLEEFDSNNDGRLAKREVKGPLLENFAKIDTDQNGFLSKEELRNAPKPNNRQGSGRPPQRR